MSTNDEQWDIARFADKVRGVLPPRATREHTATAGWRAAFDLDVVLAGVGYKPPADTRPSWSVSIREDQGTPLIGALLVLAEQIAEATDMDPSAVLLPTGLFGDAEVLLGWPIERRDGAGPGLIYRPS